MLLIPSNMSSAELFYTLYNEAILPDAPKLTSLMQATQVFKVYCTHGYCHDIPTDRGRSAKALRVDFSTFPEINAEGYDSMNGKGAAQKAVDAYQNTAKGSDQTKYDLNADACLSFTTACREKMPEQLAKEFSDMFERCEARAQAEEKALKKLEENKISFPSVCLATFDQAYSLTSNNIEWNHGLIPPAPCEAVLKELKYLAMKNADRVVESLSIHRKPLNPVIQALSKLPFLNLSKTYKYAGPLSLRTAIKIMESEVSKV